MAAAGKLWIPLESNPDTLNLYLGACGAKGAHFEDVYGVDPELLSMVPQPVLAVMLLFPITEKSEDYDVKQREQIELTGQQVDSNVYFTQQTVGNACGTVGLLHSVLNNRQVLKLDETKFFYKFLTSTLDQSPEERANALEANDELESQHQEFAAQGQSEIQEDLEDVNLHFITFVHVNGHLYELDGRKSWPVNHGPSSVDTLLFDAVKVVQDFMDRDPDNVRFNMVALCQDENSEEADADELAEQEVASSSSSSSSDAPKEADEAPKKDADSA